VSRHFVPVAQNQYDVRDRKDEEGDLHRAIRRLRGEYQGVWMVTPDLKLLAQFHQLPSGSPATRENMTQGLLTSIREALGKTGSVPLRDAKPDRLNADRGRGVRPDGSVRLALTVRSIHEGRRDGSPTLDSVVLTAEQWRAFRPEKVTEGARFVLPEVVSRQFVRALSPASDQSTMPRPQHAKTARLEARVDAVEGGQVRLRLDGSWETEHPCEGDIKRPIRTSATADGVVVYDGQRREVRSLLLVFSGTYRHFPPYDSPRETGAVIEWQAE
jgi:hypothetical protein